VQLAFPLVLGKLINVPTQYHIQPRAIFAGLGAGMLTTLLFTLPPLLDIRSVRPILILRRAVEEIDDPFIAALWKKINKNMAQILATGLILAGLVLIAMTLSDSVVVGQRFSEGLVGVLLVLLAASAAVLRGLKFFLNRTRLHLPSALRHGLANLYRPGNPSAALLAALGMGVMQIMTVYLVQRAVVNELHISSAPNLPNVFLVDIANTEIDGMRALLKAQPGVTTQPELLPLVSARVLTIDGKTTEEARAEAAARADEAGSEPEQRRGPDEGRARGPGRRMQRTVGAWWQAGERRPQVAIAQQQAQRMGAKLGSTITFAVQDQQIAATVVALTKANGQHVFSRAEYTLPKAALDGLPVVWSGGVHVQPEHVSEIQRALYVAYPTVTVINVAQALETVRAVVIQITYVIQFLAAFSIFAGVVILASSIAGTKYRRIREVVVLKTLGATRGRIATIFSIEFAVLGLVAGVVGIGFANLITHTLLHQMNLAYKAQLLLNFSALAGVAALTVATGWIASHRILQQKPLEVLREE
jgi:putative ABC transport system permease protein